MDKSDSVSMDNSSDIGTMLYDGAAEISRWRALIGVIITFIIFCFTSGMAYYIYNNEDVYENNFIKGKVKDSTCIRDIHNNTWDCNMKFLYNINNNEYTQNHRTNNSTYYSPGALIDLRYNKHDPNDITTDTLSKGFKAGMLMFFGLFVLMLALLHYYSVTTWKILAVADTAGSIASSITSSISCVFNNK